jgi:CDP-4-dehydro-6-deoxyglucose reductase
MTLPFIEARVERITPLTDSILQLILAPETYVAYQAGQYLQILVEGEALSYSIANAPLGSKTYELHIRHNHDNPQHSRLFSDIQRTGKVRIHVPLGSCSMQQLHHDKPIVFMAVGTGFAPIKAMIEQLLADGDSRDFELFWSARTRGDLYMDDTVVQWQKHVRHFQYWSHWSGASDTPLMSRVLKRHAKNLDQIQMVISGPFDMTYSTRDTLLAHGAIANQLFSDAFSFEGGA